MLHLNLKRSLESRVDASQLNVAKLASMTIEAIRQIPLPTDYGMSKVSDWFEVSGEPAEAMTMVGDLRLIDRLGAGQDFGHLRIEGNVGNELAMKMRGGSIEVVGNAGEGVGCGLSGGSVVVAGNAGEGLGRPLVGAKRGVTGGSIIVTGQVKANAAHRMRRGLIVVGGKVEQPAAVEMIAGTLVILGECQGHIGQGMRRGTIVASQWPKSNDGSRFTTSVQAQLSYLPLLWAEIARILENGVGACLLDQIPATNWVERRLGDRSVAGIGEVLVPISPNSTCHQPPISAKL